MANPKIQEILGLMQKNLECSICLELLRNPVVTSCHHHFCRFCITEFLMTKRYVPCPLCKQPVSKRSLQDKAELNNIVTCIRSLISAFQEDAGCILSPFKGPQSFFPCTPEIITKKPRLRKTKARESRSERHSDQPQKEDVCCLLDDDKDTTAVSYRLSPAESKDKQGLVDSSSSATGTNGCPILSECRTQLSVETSNSNAVKILQYLNEGSFGSTSNVQNIENISGRFNLCQLRQTGVRRTKAIDSKEQSSDAAVETKNPTDVPKASVMSCVMAHDILEKENIGSVTTESKRKKRGKDHSAKAGLADYSNSAQVEKSSQNSSDQSVSSTQQFLQPRPPITRTYSRHLSRVSSKVKNWIASLPPNPDESGKENEKVVTGLVNETLVQNNINEANNEHDSCAEMQSKGRRRTRNSLKKDHTDSCITKEVYRDVRKCSPIDNKDTESFGFMCEDSVQPKHDVHKIPLPCESEKYVDGESSIIDQVPLNAKKPDALPENPVDKPEPVLVTPPRSRWIFKKRESFAQLTPEAIPASDDPYLFEVSNTPLLKKKGRPRSKEKKSKKKPVANLRRSEKYINLSTAPCGSTQSAENKNAQMQEKVLDLKVGGHINDFPLQSLSRSIVAQEVTEISESPTLSPTEGGSNKAMGHTSRQKKRKAAEKKEEMQPGGEDRSQMKEQIEKLASWIDRAEDHALLFSTQEASASMESTENNADNGDVENDVEGDHLAVVEPLYEVKTGFSEHSEDQQKDDNVLRELDLSFDSQKNNASDSKWKDTSKRSEKTEEEALSSVTDTDSRNSSVTVIPTLVTKSYSLPCKSSQQINSSPSEYSKTEECDTGGMALATQQSYENSLCSIVFPSPVAAILLPKFNTPRPHMARQNRDLTSTVSPKVSRLRGPSVGRRNGGSTQEEKAGFDSLLEEGKTQSFSLKPSTPLTTTKYSQARLSAEETGHVPVQNKDGTVCFDQEASVLNNQKDGMEAEHLECPEMHRSHDERDLLSGAHTPLVSEFDSLEDSLAPCSSVCVTDSLSVFDRQELADVKQGTDKNTEEEKVDQCSKDCHALDDKRQTSINSVAIGIEYIDRKETEMTEESIVTYTAKSFEIEEHEMTDSANEISEVHVAVFEKSQNSEHLQNFNTDLQDQKNKGGSLETVSVISQSPLQETVNSFSSENTDPSQSILQPPQALGTKPGGMSARRVKENAANRQVSDNATTARLNNNTPNKQLIHLHADRQKSSDDKDPTVIKYKLHGSDSETTMERKKMRSGNCSKNGSPHSLLETRPLKETSNSLSTALQASDIDEVSFVLPVYNRKRKLSEANTLDQTSAERIDASLEQRLVRKVLESPLTSQSGKTIHSAPSQVTKISSSSDDEDTSLVIRRPKRKCFSLEGSPLTSKTPLATRRYKSRHARRALSKSFCLDYKHDEINMGKPGVKEKNSVSQTEDEKNIVVGSDLEACAADSDMTMGEENVADCSEKCVNMCSASSNSTGEFVIGKAVESTSVLSGQCKDVLANCDERSILNGEESITTKTTEKKDNSGAEKEDHSLSCTNDKPNCRRRTKRGLATVENADITMSLVRGFKSPVANHSGTNSDCAVHRSPGSVASFKPNILEQEISFSVKVSEPTAASTKYNSLNSLSNADNLQEEDNEESLCSSNKIVKAACEPSVNAEQYINDLQNLFSGEEASLKTVNGATIPSADFDLGYSNLDGEMLDLNDKRTNDEENAKISGDSFTPESQRYKGDQGRSLLEVQQTQTEKSEEETFTLAVQRKCAVITESYGESDDDEVVCVKKRKHFAVLSDSDSQSSDEYSDEEELSCQLSSSAVSSQSEILTTQQQQALEADLEQLRQNIAREEAKLHMLQHDDTLTPDVRTQSLKSHSDGQRLLESCAPLQDASLQPEVDQELDEKEDENFVDRNVVWEPVPSPQPHASLCEQSNEIVDINNDESNELFPSPLSPSPPPIVKPSLARKDTAILSRSIFDMDVSEVRSLTKMTKFRQVLEFTSDRAVDIPLRKSSEDMYADIQDSQDSEVLVTKASRIIPESQASIPSKAETLKCQHSSQSFQETLASLQTGQTVQFLPKSPSPVEILPLLSDVCSQDRKKAPTSVKMADSQCLVLSLEGSECDDLERDENSSSSDDGLPDSKEENEGEDDVRHCCSVEDEPKWKRKKMGFVASGLTPEKFALLRNLAENYECKVYAKFNDCVTHVIMKAHNDPAIRLCERTLKYFQGVAGRCWVLNFAWVQDCLNKGHLLPETDYEIEGDTVKGEDHFGPKISRLAIKPLLKGFAFACVGASPDMTKKEMRQLLQMSGAEVVEDPWYLAKHPAKDKLVLRCIDSEAQPVTPAETELFNGQYKHNKVVTVKREWLLDSIGTQQLQPLRFYICITGKNVKLPF